MVNMIGPNTILLYASAPSFPHGVIDPVEYMSDIAVRFDIGKQTYSIYCLHAYLYMCILVPVIFFCIVLCISKYIVYMYLNLTMMMYMGHNYDNVGLHVDCCLGGFVLPFARRLGYDVPSKLICSIFICKLMCVIEVLFICIFCVYISV